MKKLFLISILLCSSYATAQNHRINTKPAELQSLIQKLAQCEASYEELAQFNMAIDAKNFPLADVSKQYMEWGGAAWKLSNTISVFKMPSTVLISNARSNVYVYLNEKTTLEKIEELAKTLHIENKGGAGEYLDYRSDETHPSVPADRQISIIQGANKKGYWLGCIYNVPRFQEAWKDAANQTPERVALKKQLQLELRQNKLATNKP